MYLIWTNHDYLVKHVIIHSHRLLVSLSVLPFALRNPSQLSLSTSKRARVDVYVQPLPLAWAMSLLDISMAIPWPCVNVEHHVSRGSIMCYFNVRFVSVRFRWWFYLKNNGKYFSVMCIWPCISLPPSYLKHIISIVSLLLC